MKFSLPHRGSVAGQVSKPAASQTSKSAGRGKSVCAPIVGQPAGLETGDTAGLETCATTTRFRQFNDSAIQRFNTPHTPTAAFTMIEIAISLAVIGFALVAIIGIMPTAMQT